MSCTIHYQLSFGSASLAAAKQQLEFLRQRAKALPFDDVSDMIELTADDWQRAIEAKQHPLLSIAKRATLDPDRIEVLNVAPEKTVAFNVTVGKGCESAVFGLRRWSEAEEWGWYGFCKTAFAVNFLQCHLVLDRLLDHADELGLLNEVKDEGGYWQHRDWRRLAHSQGIRHTNNLAMNTLCLESFLWPKPLLFVDQEAS